jgi:hypothetical protein
MATSLFARHVRMERQVQLLLECMHRILSQEQTVLSCLLFDNVECGQSQSLPDWEAYDKSEIGAVLQAVMEQCNDPIQPCCPSTWVTRMPQHLAAVEIGPRSLAIVEMHLVEHGRPRPPLAPARWRTRNHATARDTLAVPPTPTY